MVRNLMLIVGVSVSLMAFGCSSEDGGAGSGGAAGTGGSAGGGGTGGDAGAGGAGGGVTDACTNTDDAMLVCAPGWTAQVEECAGEAAGDSADTTACLVLNSGISEACASCYGDFSECSRDECAVGGDQSCLPPGFGGDFGPGTPECEACTAAAGCDSARDACTGDLAVACE